MISADSEISDGGLFFPHTIIHYVKRVLGEDGGKKTIKLHGSPKEGKLLL